MDPADTAARTVDENMTSLGLMVTTRLGFRFSTRPLATPDQVDHRIEVMQSTAMRSVAALAPHRPTWVLQTDPVLRSHLQRRVEDGSISVPESCTVRVVARQAMDVEPRDLDVLRSFEGRFLCVRLDSDDYYFASVIGDALRRSDLRLGTLVDFSHGYLVDRGTGEVRRHSYLAQGPFYGIVTDSTDPLPAIGHHEHARNGRTAISITRRAWLQTVHDANYVTGLDRRPMLTRLRAMRGEFSRGRSARPLRNSLRRPLDLIPLSRSRQIDLATIVR